MVTVDCNWRIAEYVSGFCVVVPDRTVWFKFDKLWLVCSVQSTRRGVQQGRLGEFVKGTTSLWQQVWVDGNTHRHTHTQTECSGGQDVVVQDVTNYEESAFRESGRKKSGHTCLVENYCSRFCVADERGDGGERERGRDRERCALPESWWVIKMQQKQEAVRSWKHLIHTHTRTQFPMIKHLILLYILLILIHNSDTF